MSFRTGVRRRGRPQVTITAPPEDVRLDRDVEISMRDGVILRANVFTPPGDGSFPVIMCAHPYGKDHTPKPRRSRKDVAVARWRIPTQFHLIPQSEPLTISAWTGWEGPDPAFWCDQGYVVVNADLRGWGRSDGVGELLSAQEGRDYHDLIEWAGAQTWSTGRVGLTGVSYLAIAQWAAAAEHPPSLAAINPWEGFTDFYRDFARPGGVREDGFSVMWTRGLQAQRRSPVTLRHEQRARPEIDDWWRARNRDIERIEVPTLVCGSFSDHCLHSGGSFEGFRRIGSEHKWLYTHRGPKWATYYAAEAKAAQVQFFDHFVRGLDNGMLDVPRVRIEIREDARTATVEHAATWPPSGVTWQTLALDATGAEATGRVTRGRLVDADGQGSSSTRVAFDARRGSVAFTHRFVDDVDVIGSMWVRLHVHVDGADDANLFVGIRKRRGGQPHEAGRVVGFEGSYGFDQDLVTHAMLKLSHRRAAVTGRDDGPHEHDHTRREPLRPGEIVIADIELLPSATRFRAGDELELLVQGRWFFRFNPLLGQFPARYERSPRSTVTLHLGDRYDTMLHVPTVAVR